MVNVAQMENAKYSFADCILKYCLVLCNFNDFLCAGLWNEKGQWTMCLR